MKISIKYCTQWNHLPRVVTLLTNILGKHTTNISKVEIIPATNGIFDVYVNDDLIFSRKNLDRMPNELEIENMIDKLI